MVRAHIRLMTTTEATEFVSGLNTANSEDSFAMIDGDCRYHVDARSLMGAIYMMTEHNDSCYLVNETHEGAFPSCIDKFRII